jgi:uncharacterized membrane protein YedE/YeeE
MNIVASLVCGLIFGTGLLISGMTQPAKVLGFLDILGRWDPTLAFVMAGALAVSAAGFALARRASAPVFAARHHWPTHKDIDRPLVGGAILFGMGWGLVGLCPGPAVVNIASLSPRVLLFVLAMVGGMALQGWRQSRAERMRPRSGQQPALAPTDG